MTSPAYTLTLLEELNHYLINEQFGGHYIPHFIEDTMTLNDMEGSNSTAFSEEVAAQIIAGTRRSTAFYCDEEMSTFVGYAASVVDSSDRADTSIIPARDGFCYFDKGIHVAEDSKMIIHAVSWTRIKWVNGEISFDIDGPDDLADNPMWVVVGYNDALKEPDFSGNSYLEALKENPGVIKNHGRFGPRYVDFYASGAVVDPTGSRGLTSEEIVTKAINRGVVSPDMKYINPAIHVRTLFHSLILMMSQPNIIEVGPAPMSKKKLAKAKGTGSIPEVLIIDIRKKKVLTGSASDEEHDGSFNYSHRWLVSGFWRWQPFKDEDGKKARKRIWIAPFIKGPVDKPLVLKQKVYTLTM